MASGRTTTYTDELAKKICDLVATSDKGLKQICAENDDLPVASTIYLWRLNVPAFSDMYLKAKRLQGEIYAESTLEIAAQKPTYIDEKGIEKVDAAHVAWQKLNVNTRQWHAARLAPKVYGDKLQNDAANNQGFVEEIAQKVAEINKQSEEDY